MIRIPGYAVPAVLLAGALATSGCAAGASSRSAADVSVDNPATGCRPGVNAAEYWLMDAAQLNDLKASHPASVRYGMKPANGFTLAGAPFPTGRTVAYFKSYEAFRTAIVRRSIARSTWWVGYDNETWAPTPVKEQRQPLVYEKLFADLAHKKGYKVILTPAQDLVGGRTNGTAPWQKYLSEGFAKVSGRLADIYEIQAQADETAPYRSGGSYVRFVRAAAAQAHAANPKVTVFAGLSTDRVAGAPQLYQDFLATRGLVSGYWLNIPRPAAPGLAMAAAFLRDLPRAASATGRTCPIG